MKKILILGGGQAQVELIKTAKQMRLFVIVVGINGNFPGYQYADKVYYEDVFDKDAVLNVAMAEHINGIAMVCSDFGLETVGYVNDHLHLSGISEKVAADSSNKMKMKELLISANVNTAKFCQVKTDSDVEAVVSKLLFPMIVKAVDLQGSRGIYICNTKEELLQNYKKSIAESRQDYCIVEEFITGEEFGAQAFVYDGNVLFVQAHGDTVFHSGRTNVPIGHHMPFHEGEEMKNTLVKKYVTKAVKAMNFNNCAVNVDLIIKDGIPYVVELTGRAGANFLPELTGYFLGINYYKMVILSSLGISPIDYFNERSNGHNAVVTRMLYSNKSGIISDINIGGHPNIKICSLFVKEGDSVNAFSNSRDCIGKILCVGNSVSECDETMDLFISNKINYKIN